MKIKKLWIPAVIIGIIGGAAKICDTLFNYTGKGFFLDKVSCNVIFIISIIAVLAIGIGMLFADRKTEIYSAPTKSIPAAFFGFIASVSIVGSGVISVLSIGSTEYPLVTFINIILGLLGGVVMLYESCICFTGQNGIKRIPYLVLALPAWSCGRLISLFVEYSKISLNATEMFDVIAVALLTMFMFDQAMFLAEIDPQKCVGKTVLYGSGFMLCTLITTTDIILKMIVPAKDTVNVDTFIVLPTLSRILTCTTDIALCGFALFFMISMVKNIDVDDAEEEESNESMGDDEFFGYLPTGAKENVQADDTEVAEPVEFSGSALTLEDTLSISRKEIEKAAKEKEEAAKYDESADETGNNQMTETSEYSESGLESAPDLSTDVGDDREEEKTEIQPSEPIIGTEVQSDGESRFEEIDVQAEENNETAVNYEENGDISSDKNTSRGGFENIFADVSGDDDYEDVCRLLNEISENENF